MADSSPVVTATPGSSRTKKTLIGCAVGCGALFLILIILVISFFAWLNRRGEVIQPTTLVSEDTVGYGAWEMSPDDEATVLFFIGAMDAAQRTPDGLPGFLKMVQEFNAKKNREQYKEMLPMTVAWTSVRTPDSDQNAFLGTLSASKLGNQLILADMLFGMLADREGLSESYRGERIYDFNRDRDASRIAGFVRGGDVFFTADAPTARRALDRMLDGVAPSIGAATGTSQGLQSFLTSVPESPIRIAFLNESGQAATLFDMLDRSSELLGEMSRELAGNSAPDSEASEEPEFNAETAEVALETADARPYDGTENSYDSIQAFSIHGDFDTPERLRTEWVFNCDEPGCAGTPIVENFERFVDENQRHGLDFALTVREQNAGLSIQLTSENLLAWMEEQRTKLDTRLGNHMNRPNREGN